MRTRSLLAVTLAVGVLAGCSSDPAPTAATSPASTSPSPTPTPTPTPTPAVVVTGGDAALTKVIEGVYAGKTGVEAEAKVGTWKKEKVAVVTSGDDVTLLVGPTWKVVGGWWPSLDKPASLGKSPRFVMTLGTDAHTENLKGSRADSLQILGIDGKGGGGIVGIPRDLWVPLSTGGTAKINAAFAYGGGEAQVATIKRLSGIPIEGYVATGFSGFRKIVNESGGLPLTIEKAFDFLGILHVDAGKQVADGNTALAYARERKSLPNGDFGRSGHQQEILLAGAIQARLDGPLSLPREMTIVSKHAESDLDATQMLTFLAAFYRLNPTKVGHAVAPGAIGTSADGQSIVKVTSGTTAVFRSFTDGRL